MLRTSPPRPLPRLACLALLLALPVGLACSKDSPAPAATSAPFVVPAAGGAVNIVADEKGFTPAEVQVTKGSPLSLVFTRTSDNTCATEVVFPELKVRRPLPLNQPVAIEMPTQLDRTYRFQCGMAMWQGSVVIK